MAEDMNEDRYEVYEEIERRGGEGMQEGLITVCSGSEDEVLKRLLELKELYKVQRDELGGVC